MSRVYIVMSELNGYKNVESVYANEDNAWAYRNELANDWHYDRHDLYVVEYYVMDMPVG